MSDHMPSAVFDTVEHELEFLGDILCVGIIKKGLTKMGATPDSASVGDMCKALDGHIQAALVSFVGKDEARRIVVDLKRKLERMECYPTPVDEALPGDASTNPPSEAVAREVSQ